LPVVGGVRDARPAEPRDALHRRRALDEVDGHRVALPRRRERRGLPGRLDERLEMRPRDLAEVEAGEDDVPELEQPQPEPVAPRVLHVLDEAPRDEGGEQPRDAAGVDARPAGDLVGAELGVRLGERVQDAERPLHGADEPDRWLSSSGHEFRPRGQHCREGTQR
jgi:hypothetical protein